MSSPAGHWFWLREDQCCVRDDCKRPSYLGGLCAFCFMGARTVERAVALLIHTTDREVM
jgi:hypothetical protein